MTITKPPPQQRAATPRSPVPAHPTRKVRKLPPLQYCDVRAVAETCVLEAARQTAMRGVDNPQNALSVALLYESFKKQVSGEVARSPSYAEGFGEERESPELGERFAYCLDTLVEGELLRYIGARPMYDTENPSATFSGTLQLTPSLMNAIAE